jgi:hypothetical protein
MNGFARDEALQTLRRDGRNHRTIAHTASTILTPIQSQSASRITLLYPTLEHVRKLKSLNWTLDKLFYKGTFDDQLSTELFSSMAFVHLQKPLWHSPLVILHFHPFQLLPCSLHP